MLMQFIRSGEMPFNYSLPDWSLSHLIAFFLRSISILLKLNGVHSHILNLPHWWWILERKCKRSQISEMVPSAGCAVTFLGILQLLKL